jgi:hypothetical protein
MRVVGNLRLTAMRSFKEHAQDGRGVRLAARGSAEFLCCKAARSRALCASERVPNKKSIPMKDAMRHGALSLSFGT